FDDSQPLASLGHVLEGLGARFPGSAPQFIVVGSREEQDRFGNPRPRVVGKDQSRALRRQCDIGAERIGSLDAELVARTRLHHHSRRTHRVPDEEGLARFASAFGPLARHCDVHESSAVG
ncbi:MAG: hypothetical protein ACK55I_24860, partial [bacterium]